MCVCVVLSAVRVFLCVELCVVSCRVVSCSVVLCVRARVCLHALYFVSINIRKYLTQYINVFVSKCV